MDSIQEYSEMSTTNEQDFREMSTNNQQDYSDMAINNPTSCGPGNLKLFGNLNSFWLDDVLKYRPYI